MSDFIKQMPLHKALERMKWRLENGKYEPNENDVIAFTTVLDWINNEKQSRFKEMPYQLFGKLFVYSLKHLVCHYRDVNFSIKQLIKEINSPFDFHVKMLAMQLNQIEIENFASRNAIESTNNLVKDQEVFKNWLESNEKNKTDFIKNSNKWSNDEVKKSSLNTITNIINDYKPEL